MPVTSAGMTAGSSHFMLLVLDNGLRYSYIADYLARKDAAG